MPRNQPPMPTITRLINGSSECLITVNINGMLNATCVPGG